MISFRRASAKPIQRIYAVGDIHGRFDLFSRLMDLIERDQAGRVPVPTQVLLLGDIIDRGPDSARMVRCCMTLTAASRRFVVLKGNHEEMMVEALRGNLKVFGHWLNFGGRAALLSWGVAPDVLQEPVTLAALRTAAAAVGNDVLTWLANLPLYHQHDGFLFVHAGIRPGVPLRKQRPEDLLWITDDFLNSSVAHGMTVVHGHSISESGAAIRTNRIGIDTGAYRTERLTALGVENGETWTLNTISTPKERSEADDGAFEAYYTHDLAHVSQSDSLLVSYGAAEQRTAASGK